SLSSEPVVTITRASLRPPNPSCPSSSLYFFFFNDTATTEIYTLSLHGSSDLRGYVHPDAAGLRPLAWFFPPCLRSGNHGSACPPRPRSGRRCAAVRTSSNK